MGYLFIYFAKWQPRKQNTLAKRHTWETHTKHIQAYRHTARQKLSNSINTWKHTHTHTHIAYIIQNKTSKKFCNFHFRALCHICHVWHSMLPNLLQLVLSVRILAPPSQPEPSPACPKLTCQCGNSRATLFQCHWTLAAAALAADLPACRLQARDHYVQSHLHWGTNLSGEWNALSPTVESTALWFYYHPVLASCLTVNDFLLQSRHLLHATPMTVIHQCLLFIFK